MEHQTMLKTYKGKITKLEPNQIFVFGSNPQGKHGKGAAAFAKKFCGARNGQGAGLQGQSYGIITKDLSKRFHPSVPFREIVDQIARLYDFADEHQDKEFLIAYSGRGKLLSGYTPEQMAIMFYNAQWRTTRTGIPANIVFEEEFAKLLIQLRDNERRYKSHEDDGCTCQSCGKTFRVDIIVPDYLWEKIKPEGKPKGGGLLCGSCIMERLESMGFGAFRLSEI